MTRLILGSVGLAIAMAIVLVFGAGTASAQHFGGYHGGYDCPLDGGYGGYGGYGYAGGIRYGYPSVGLYGTGYRGYGINVSFGRGGYFHDTSHYDYHPGHYRRHHGHYDYIPGHYDLHRTGHYHH